MYMGTPLPLRFVPEQNENAYKKKENLPPRSSFVIPAPKFDPDNLSHTYTSQHRFPRAEKGKTETRVIVANHWRGILYHFPSVQGEWLGRRGRLWFF